MTGEENADEPTALVGEADRDEAAIIAPAGPAHQPAQGEIADHHRDVAAAAQQLASEVALAERAQVPQRLEGAELADGETGCRHAGLEPRGHRLRRPHQLDVGVQSRDLGPALRDSAWA